MKNSHKIILLVSIMMALFSAYSLASSNVVNKIEFTRYAKETNSFYYDDRESGKQKWSDSHYPKYMEFHVLNSMGDLVFIKGERGVKELTIPPVRYEDEMLIVSTLGEVYSAGYGLRVTEVAQKGNIVEVKMDLWNPQVLDQQDHRTRQYIPPDQMQYPVDIIKINKKDFTVKGKLLFIFKNQDGISLFEKYCDIR